MHAIGGSVSEAVCKPSYAGTVVCLVDGCPPCVNASMASTGDVPNCMQKRVHASSAPGPPVATMPPWPADRPPTVSTRTAASLFAIGSSRSGAYPSSGPRRSSPGGKLRQRIAGSTRRLPTSGETPRRGSSSNSTASRASAVGQLDVDLLDQTVDRATQLLPPLSQLAPAFEISARSLARLEPSKCPPERSEKRALRLGR
jgi:hypothetical protein